MSPDGQIRGGCRCGAIRFEAGSAPIWQSYCHCRDCRRATGAPVTAFVGVSDRDLQFRGDRIAEYASSDDVVRSFCTRCGTPLYYRDRSLPGETYLYVGALDAPERFPPRHHAWVSERLAWLALDDDLEQHSGMSRQRTGAGVTKPARTRGSDDER